MAQITPQIFSTITGGRSSRPGGLAAKINTLEKQIRQQSAELNLLRSMRIQVSNQVPTGLNKLGGAYTLTINLGDIGRLGD